MRCALIGSTLVLFTGGDVLGAKRWIDFGWMTLQPSEFLKPGFAILARPFSPTERRCSCRRRLITFLADCCRRWSF